MEVETTPSVSGGDLVAALEQATLMAKQHPTTTDPSQLYQILTTLRSAHHHLSLILSTNKLLPPSHHPQPMGLPTPPPENSVSSAVDGGDENDETGGGEPMLMGDDDDEQNSRATSAAAAAVERVAGRMRECFIQNKRAKRQLSPSAAELRRSYENEADWGGAVAAEFDPLGTKLRSLDLIYQFHA